jgi:hypothetical protein
MGLSPYSLAQLLDSLVRVSRRVDQHHFDKTISQIDKNLQNSPPSNEVQQVNKL